MLNTEKSVKDRCNKLRICCALFDTQDGHPLQARRRWSRANVSRWRNRCWKTSRGQYFTSTWLL